MRIENFLNRLARFDVMMTPSIMTLFWNILWLGILAYGTVMSIYSVYQNNLYAFALFIIGTIVAIIVGRVLIEFVLVVFMINDKLSKESN